MGYDIHITRGDSWIEEETPVTLEQVRGIMPMLSKGFRIVESGIISLLSSGGQELTMNVGPCLEYTDKDGEKTVVIFEDGRCPEFRYQSDSQILAMCSVAEALGAKLLGDEDEEYTR